MRVLTLLASMSSPPISRLLSITAGGSGSTSRGGTGTGLPIFGASAAVETLPATTDKLSTKARTRMQRGVTNRLLLKNAPILSTPRGGDFPRKLRSEERRVGKE